MSRSKLLLLFSSINLVMVFIGILCLPNLVAIKFNSDFVVTEVVSRWYNIIIPSIQVISCFVILFVDFKEEGKIQHVYRYIVTYVAVAIATFYTWIMMCMQFGGYALGDVLHLPISAIILLPIALFMIVYGVYERLLPFKSKSIFGYSWVKENIIIWNHTHRLAGLLCSITGLLIMILAILNEIVLKTNWIYLIAVILIACVYYLITYLYTLKLKTIYL